MADPVRVLHVEDADAPAALVAESLAEAGAFDVTRVGSGEAALTELSERTYDCIVSDHDMPGMDGMELLRRVRDRDPEVPFFLFTGRADRDVAGEAVEAGATGYVRKGSGSQYAVLTHRVERAVDERRAAAGADLDDAVRSVLVAAADGADREDIERRACARLAAVDGFAFVAVVVESGDGNGEGRGFDVVPTTWAGDDRGYFGAVEWGDRAPADPVSRAVADGEVHTADVVPPAAGGDAPTADGQAPAADADDRDGDPRATADDPETAVAGDADRDGAGSGGDADPEGWRAPLARRDVGSVGAFPLGGTERGAVVVYADRAGAFDDRRGRALADLAEGLGRAFDRVAATEGLRRRVADLERRAERAESFASVVSHDIRGPLDVAEGYLREARHTGDERDFEAAADAIGRAKDLAGEMLTLVRTDDAVDPSEAVSPSAVAADARDAVEGSLDLEVTVERPVVADRAQLRRVFENLFRNAVQHSPDDGGPVTVRVDELADGEGFYVADDGPGIPHGDRESVFEPGYTTDADAGTGLGLAIVRRVAEAHGWSVRATAADDGGARFEFDGVTFGDGDGDGNGGGDGD